jgi:hypothetical protein
MSGKKGLGRLYDRLTPEERFRLDVLALARGDEEESERLTATCPRRGYTMNDWGFVGRWEAARELAMLAYKDVARCLDKIKMIAAFRGLFPYLSTIWEDDEEEAERNADPAMDEDLRKLTGEERYARLEGKLEEMERDGA